jgi:hypothetical protein
MLHPNGYLYSYMCVRWSWRNGRYLYIGNFSYTGSINICEYKTLGFLNFNASILKFLRGGGVFFETAAWQDPEIVCPDWALHRKRSLCTGTVQAAYIAQSLKKKRCSNTSKKALGVIIEHCIILCNTAVYNAVLCFS